MRHAAVVSWVLVSAVAGAAADMLDGADYLGKQNQDLHKFTADWLRHETKQETMELLESYDMYLQDLCHGYSLDDIVDFGVSLGEAIRVQEITCNSTLGRKPGENLPGVPDLNARAIKRAWTQAGHHKSVSWSEVSRVSSRVIDKLRAADLDPRIICGATKLELIKIGLCLGDVLSVLRAVCPFRVRAVNDSTPSSVGWEGFQLPPAMVELLENQGLLPGDVADLTTSELRAAGVAVGPALALRRIVRGANQQSGVSSNQLLTRLGVEDATAVCELPLPDALDIGLAEADVMEVCGASYIHSADQECPATGCSFDHYGALFGTDKVSIHNYGPAYDRILQGYRHRPVRVLEVGLGCDMNYGPGKSAGLWRRYMPKARTDFVEYEVDCAQTWRDHIPGRVFIGDQMDVLFQNYVARTALAEHNGFDVIIDDGGHEMRQQITSFEILWRALKPGGVYIIEDLGTSYQNRYHGGRRGQPSTTIARIKSLLDDIHCPDSGAECSLAVGGIDPMEIRALLCWQHICGIEKRGIDDRPILQDLYGSSP